MINKSEFKINADIKNIEEAIKFVENKLVLNGHEKNKILKTLLLCEETMVQMIKKKADNSLLLLRITSSKNKSLIEISCKGEKCDISTNATIGQVTDYNDNEDEQSLIISKFILKGLKDKISLRYVNGYNKALIKLTNRENDGSILSFGCLIIGILTGIVFKLFLPNDFGIFVEQNICSNITSLFLDLISMVVVPLVFFSIADGVTGFSDIKAFGKVGGKVMGLYCVTTFIAVFASILSFLLLSPGSTKMLPSVLKMLDSSIEVTQGNLSIIDTLINIVPDNFLKPFLSGDMLQIIFIAILFGFASGKIGEYSAPVQNFIKAGNALFSKITSIVIITLPLAILSMSFSLVYYLELSALNEIFTLFCCLLICCVFMLCVYFSLVKFIGKYSVFDFINKFKKSMITAFSTCSSGVTMPFSMKALDEMGVSPRIYSFSIPLGATVNMDGACINFMLTILFMCRIFGIEIDAPALFSFILSVVIFSFGAPCVAGSGVAFMALLLTQMGIPVGAIAFIVPIASFMEFFETVLNVTGDASVTIAVARSEGLLSEKK